MLFFTICANNYLARALVLGDSLKRNDPAADFYIVLADKAAPSVDYSSLGHPILFIEQIENKAGHLWSRYNTVELSTSIKPRAFQYFFAEKQADPVVFLDPDIAVYAKLDEVYRQLEQSDILLTPHILQPIPYDGLTPWETPFHRVGIFNLGFLAVKRTENTGRFLQWWKERTYEFGYNRQQEGLFTDQIFINHVPVFFEKVSILKHPGYNMAPWNLQERRLTRQDDGYLVNGTYPLVFFHFSTFDFGKIELPWRKYDRFRIIDRPDLLPLYTQYNDWISERGEEKLAGLPPAYEQFRLSQQRRMERHHYRSKNIMQKIFWGSLGILPVKFKKKMIYFFNKDLERHK